MRRLTRNEADTIRRCARDLQRIADELEAIDPGANYVMGSGVLRHAFNELRRQRDQLDMLSANSSVVEQ